ncbi:MAG: ABC transporter substrate-binding protein [Clostridia bacterium]|nr:ABC transporter substrate-binding protein [Clostridia bacterium]
MAETIYTIPVSEAFEADCECPVCELRKRFEASTIDYFAGPSLMEPDTRILTNDVGFCGRHFDLLYNSQAKKLGLGLMLDTYMTEQIARIEKYSKGVSVASTASAAYAASADSSDPADAAGSANVPDFADAPAEQPKKRGLFGKRTSVSEGSYGGLVKYLKKHLCDCAVCQKLDYTMSRYVDIIFHQYRSDSDFRAKVRNSKGFCIPHTALLLELAPEKLSGSRRGEFCDLVVALLKENLKRIEGDVLWFTQKFDYRNQNADWGNSRDALPRGIQKMTGNTDVL